MLALDDFNNLEYLHFASIDSTNEEVKRRFPVYEKDILVISDSQTSGKGRKGRSFFSPPDTGLYLSFGTRSKFAFKDVLKVTSATAVIASRALRKILNVDACIKWVNDIYFEDKKVCGILAECFLNPDSSIDIVVGIGINLSCCDFPEEIKNKAGSLGVNQNDLYRYKSLIASYILRDLQRFFKNPDGFEYIDDYKRFSCVLGKDVVLFDAKGEFARGRVVDFDKDGAILIDDGSKIEKYDNGELSLKF